jgi:hypothetical protein
MVRLLVDEDQLHQQLQAARAGTDAMDAIKEAIDSLVLAREEELSALPPPVVAAESSIEQPSDVAPAVDNVGAVVAAPVMEEEVVPPAFVDEAITESSRSKKFAERFQKTSSLQQRAQPSKVEPRAAAPEDRDAIVLDEDSDDARSADGSKKGKKKGDKSRALVFDEKRGEVVAKRKRRGNRSGEWGEDEF